ncbi:MAG TPA: outer membrane beta-barrel protein, partial [Cyclobacteriaceae bacterium]
TYVGDERSQAAPQFRTRYFSDVFFIYTKAKWSATGCIYGGIQATEESDGQSSSDKWWQANLIGKYSFTDKVSLSGRVEYFSDPRSVQIVPVTGVTGFSAYSTGLCFNLQIASNVVARFEGRTFFSEKEMFLKDGNPSNTSNLLISNLTVWF